MRAAAAVPLLVLATVVVGAAAVEVGLRVLTPGAPDLRALHMAEPAKPWLYRPRPGAEGELDRTPGIRYRINANGFRGPAYTREHPEGAFRIAVLGDAITFGFGVEEADLYTALLEAELAKSLSPRKVEVLNFGVGGYNAYNEAELFDGIGAEYRPDLVLVQFCINDLNDPRLHFDAQTLQLPDLPDAAFPDPRVRELKMPERSPLAFCTGKLRLCDVLQHVRYERREDGRVVARAVAPHRELVDPEREWLRTQYAKLHQWADAHGAGFGVVVFPYPKQLDDPSRDGISYDMKRLGHEEGWAVIDLLPVYREAAMRRKREPLFLDLWHPNPAGHHLAAQALAETLRGLGLVPSS